MSDRPEGRRRRLLAWAGLAVSVLALGVLGAYAGVGEIAAALAKAGPALLALVLLHPFWVIPMAEAWRLLFPEGTAPRHLRTWLAMWCGQSVNLLIPTGTVGGEIAKMRIVAQSGTPLTASLASVVADKTGQAVTVVALLIAGTALLAFTSADPAILKASGITAAALVLGIGAFVVLQRSHGVSGFIERFSGKGEGLMAAAHVHTRNMELMLHRIYAKPGRFLLSVAIRVAANVALASEIWLAAQLMGLEVTMLDALTLRVLGFALRSAAFFVAGGLGVQEATYALLSGAIGVPPADLIALSLATRVRELLASVPGLLVWMGLEARAKLAAEPQAPSGTPPSDPE